MGRDREIKLVDKVHAKGRSGRCVRTFRPPTCSKATVIRFAPYAGRAYRIRAIFHAISIRSVSPRAAQRDEESNPRAYGFVDASSTAISLDFVLGLEFGPCKNRRILERTYYCQTLGIGVHAHLGHRAAEGLIHDASIGADKRFTFRSKGKRAISTACLKAAASINILQPSSRHQALASRRRVADPGA